MYVFRRQVRSAPPTTRPRPRPDRYDGNREPAVADLLDDSLTRAVMARDAITRDTVVAVIDAYRATVARAGAV